MHFLSKIHAPTVHFLPAISPVSKTLQITPVLARTCAYSRCKSIVFNIGKGGTWGWLSYAVTDQLQKLLVDATVV